MPHQPFVRENALLNTVMHSAPRKSTAVVNMDSNNPWQLIVRAKAYKR